MKNSFVQPIQLGKLKLKNNVFYSPLAGVSDYPFRQMAARYSPGLIFCEMVKMEALIRNDANTFQILEYHRDMHPIGAQLVGGNPKIAGESARIIEDLGFDVVDLNCGCPVDKVTKDGSGSGLLKNPEKIGDVLSEIIAAVKIPVTVKIRAGWDEDHIYAPQITRIAEEAGACAISVHGRTRVQAYRGLANRDYIKECVDAADTILVIGNGDIFCPESAFDMFEKTGCDAILASRGTMGQPWLAEEIIQTAQGTPPPKKTHLCRIQALKEHFEAIRSYYPEKPAVISMRKAGCWYLKQAPAIRQFRSKICRVNSLDEVETLLKEMEKELI